MAAKVKSRILLLLVKMLAFLLVISTAHGLKFADTKVAYHAAELPGIRSDTRPDPESSLPTNPSFSHCKTTPFRKPRWTPWDN